MLGTLQAGTSSGHGVLSDLCCKWAPSLALGRWGPGGVPETMQGAPEGRAGAWLSPRPSTHQVFAVWDK